MICRIAVVVHRAAIAEYPCPSARACARSRRRVGDVERCRPATRRSVHVNAESTSTGNFRFGTPARPVEHVAAAMTPRVRDPSITSAFIQNAGRRLKTVEVPSFIVTQRLRVVKSVFAAAGRRILGSFSQAEDAIVAVSRRS